MKKHIIFITAVCLLLTACTQKAEETLTSESVSTAAISADTAVVSDISETGKADETTNNDSNVDVAENSVEDEEWKMLEPIVNKLTSGETTQVNPITYDCRNIYRYGMNADDEEAMQISVVSDDYNYYMYIDGYCYALDSDEYDIINNLVAGSADPAQRLIGSKFECDEPITEEDYIKAAQGCVYSWLETLKSEKGEYAITSYGTSSKASGKFLDAGMVSDAKEFSVEVFFSVCVPSLYQESVFREPSNSGYNTFYHYYDGTCAFVRCRWEDGICTVVDYDSAYMANLSEGLNGINTNSRYATFFDFLNDKETVRDYRENGVRSAMYRIISHNPFMLSDGRIFFVDIDLYEDRIVKELDDGRLSAQFSNSFYSADGIGVYSSPVRYNNDMRVPYTMAFYEDFEIIFDDYNYDGNPDYAIKVDDDKKGALYSIEGIDTDGSPRAYRDEVYIAGRFEDSIRLQNTATGYVTWDIDDSGKMIPSIEVDDYTMYSQKFYLPIQLRGYSENDNNIICYFWNNTDSEVTVGTTFTVEQKDGDVWTEVMNGSVPSQSISPYHEGEFSFDISALKDKISGEYRIGVTCGENKVYGGFYIDGETDKDYVITCENEKVLPADRLSIPFMLKNEGLLPIRITDAELMKDGSKVCDIDVSHLGLISAGNTAMLEAFSDSCDGFEKGTYSVKLSSGNRTFTVGNTALIDVPESSRTYFGGTAKVICEDGKYIVTVTNNIYDHSDAPVDYSTIEVLRDGIWLSTSYCEENIGLDYYLEEKESIPYGESRTYVFADLIDTVLSNEEYSEYFREEYEMLEEELGEWLENEYITQQEYDNYMGLDFEEYLYETFGIPKVEIKENDLCRVSFAGEYVYFYVK